MRFVTLILMGGMCLLNSFTPRISTHATAKNATLYVTHYENVLGTSMVVKIFTKSEHQSLIAETAALKEISRLSNILSVYNAESEVSKWLKSYNQPIVVSEELFSVLSLFDKWRVKTNGALDASAQIINKLWKESANNGEVPNESSIIKAVADVNQIHWKLDPKANTASHTSHSPLMLNSFVKSYIIQSAVNVAMKDAKLQGIIVNIGGDMIIAGDITETVAVSNPKADAENEMPLALLSIQNKAIATSGNYRRGENIHGQWYSHIVDPRTGMPCDEVISATVIATSATDAGALATAFNVMAPKESIAMASLMPGIDYLIITQKGERIESQNFHSLILPNNVPKLPAENVFANVIVQKAWKNEVVINLSLTQPPGFAKRPFAAFWIEDEEKNTVKTIALWYNKIRWLPDVREWYRKNGKSMTADPAFYSSITSATRSPGKYTLKWDGKDDKGNIVKPGIYTIYLEVVREHGGYDLIHQAIECKDKEIPQTFILKGNVEIESALIEFRKKTADN